MPNLHVVWLHITANNVRILNVAQQSFIDSCTSLKIIKSTGGGLYVNCQIFFARS